MTNAKLLLFLTLAILAALPWRTVASESISLIWDASPDADVAGYNVRYGRAGGNYTEEIQVGPDTSATISGLVAGQTYYIAITDNNWNGQESPPSNEIVYTVPGIAPPSSLFIETDSATGEATLNWSPAADPDVVGYNIYWSVGSDAQLDPDWSRTTTQFLIPEYLPPGTILYFAVTAYNNYGEESGASAEVAYTVPAQPTANTAVAVSAPVLTLQQLPANGLTGVFSVTAIGAVSATWTLEASSDLQTWNTLTTGSDPAVNVTVVVSAKPKLFFRLASDLPDVPMQNQTPANAFPNSFCVTTADLAMPDWNIQSSEDLQTWNPLTSGTGTSLNMAVVTTGAPSLFFRLKSR